MKIRTTRRSRERFAYFSQCEDTMRMEPIQYDPGGHSAEECFHSRETYGETPSCREPELLARAINGKEQHGLNVTHIAEDYIGRIAFACEIRQFPEWVQRDIFGRARQIAMASLGYVPAFVATGHDFTIISAA